MCSIPLLLTSNGVELSSIRVAGQSRKSSPRQDNWWEVLRVDSLVDSTLRALIRHYPTWNTHFHSRCTTFYCVHCLRFVCKRGERKASVIRVLRHPSEPDQDYPVTYRVGLPFSVFSYRIHVWSNLFIARRPDPSNRWGTYSVIFHAIFNRSRTVSKELMVWPVQRERKETNNRHSRER